jgi:hypothetical protein
MVALVLPYAAVTVDGTPIAASGGAAEAVEATML